MSYVLGIDPGKDGALAMLSDDDLHVFRMPVVRTVVGRGRRDRVDPQGVWDLMSALVYADLVVIEGVGGRARQSAAAAFVFGYSTALPHMAAIACGLKVEVVQPQTWKRWSKIPPKNDIAAKRYIIKRATDLFPENQGDFYTERGRTLDGCAEAALIASWGREMVLKEGRFVGHAHARLTGGKRVW